MAYNIPPDGLAGAVALMKRLGEWLRGARAGETVVRVQDGQSRTVTIVDRSGESAEAITRRAMDALGREAESKIPQPPAPPPTTWTGMPPPVDPYGGSNE